MQTNIFRQYELIMEKKVAYANHARKIHFKHQIFVQSMFRVTLQF